jgi:3-hydroxy-3-methylglutaryl CoA synthase
MVVNFRACGISRGARKLARTPTLNKNKKKEKIIAKEYGKGTVDTIFSFSSNKF